MYGVHGSSNSNLIKMKTIQIGGYTAQNFGSNNYSHEMEAIIFNPKDITPEQVKSLPNVFLHPTCEPNSMEIFALLGTKEQFDSFYKSEKSSYCSKKAVDKFGLPKYDDRETWNKLHAYEKELESSFKAWYE